MNVTKHECRLILNQQGTQPITDGQDSEFMDNEWNHIFYEKYLTWFERNQSFKYCLLEGFGTLCVKKNVPQLEPMYSTNTSKHISIFC